MRPPLSLSLSLPPSLPPSLPLSLLSLSQPLRSTPARRRAPHAKRRRPRSPAALGGAVLSPLCRLPPCSRLPPPCPPASLLPTSIPTAPCRVPRACTLPRAPRLPAPPGSAYIARMLDSRVRVMMDSLRTEIEEADGSIGAR